MRGPLGSRVDSRGSMAEMVFVLMRHLPQKFYVRIMEMGHSRNAYALAIHRKSVQESRADYDVDHGAAPQGVSLRSPRDLVPPRR
jgi:hypothetical protein